MTGFKELAFAAQRLDDVLRTAYVGMVPCYDAGQFDSSTEKWEKEVCDMLKEIKLLNSKALLVKATLQKDLVPDSDVGESVTWDLCNSVGNSLRWRRVLRTIAMCRAAKEVSDNRDTRSEECLIIDELSGKLFKQQQKLDLLDEMEATKRTKLSEARGVWRKCTEEYGVRSKVNYMGKRKEEPIPDNLNLMIRKIDIMQTISNRLLTSSHIYDWSQDTKGFVPILHKLRREKITSETFA